MEAETTTHVPDVCALANLPIGQYQPGDLVFVTGITRWYFFDPLNGSAVNGTTIVSSPRGPAQTGCTKPVGTDPARWVRTTMVADVGG
jgi:hypothetical protein